MLSTWFSISGLLSCILLAIAVTAILLVIQFIHFCVVLAWTDRKTLAGNYFQLPEHDRQRFKKNLRWHAVLLSPFLQLLSKFNRLQLADTSIKHDGIALPKGSCSTTSIERATRYRAQPEDVFVVTQMKCGTTWMQHLLLQVLTRGNADLPDSGETLGALSPWLESDRSLDATVAPLVGSERPSRMIKTHLPASHLPDNKSARYIYVVRHPVSCFASCVDFLRSNLGPFSPGIDECLDWFQSDELMWFGTWPNHVAGWLDRAKRGDNLLMIRFEDMKADLPQVVERITSFVDLAPLKEHELKEVLRKCRFEQMRDNAGNFEMQPPHLLQHSSNYFLSGKSNRYSDVPRPIQQQLVEWCRQKLEGRQANLQDLYTDLFTAKNSSAVVR